MENSRRPSEAFDCHNTAGKKEVCERFKYAVSACLPRAPGCTFDVVGARLSPGSRFRTNGYGRAQDAESKSDVRSPETWPPEAARRRRPAMCRDVGGPVRRVWFTSPHTERCTRPLPRWPPSAPGLCGRTAPRTLPSIAMSGSHARRGPTWTMSPDGAFEAGRRNRPEAHRTRAARRRTSRHGVRQAQAFHVKHTSCTPSL